MPDTPPGSALEALVRSPSRPGRPRHQRVKRQGSAGVRTGEAGPWGSQPSRPAAPSVTFPACHVHTAKLTEHKRDTGRPGARGPLRLCSQREGGRRFTEAPATLARPCAPSVTPEGQRCVPSAPCVPGGFFSHPNSPTTKSRALEPGPPVPPPLSFALPSFGLGPVAGWGARVPAEVLWAGPSWARGHHAPATAGWRMSLQEPVGRPFSAGHLLPRGAPGAPRPVLTPPPPPCTRAPCPQAAPSPACAPASALRLQRAAPLCSGSSSPRAQASPPIFQFVVFSLNEDVAFK